LWTKYAPQGLHLIVVHEALFGETDAAVLGWVHALLGTQVKVPVINEATPKIMSLYASGTGVPNSFVISRDFSIRKNMLGWDGDVAGLEALLKIYL
jgi:hypothetical protein